MIQRGLRRCLHLLDDYMGEEERKEMSNWSSGPKVLYDSKKSTKLCPLTRYYCTPVCAMAVEYNRMTQEWLCGLVYRGENGTAYETVKYQPEE